MASLDGEATRLPPFPLGWYAVGFSSEFARGTVQTRTLGGRELLIARTESGRLSAMDPICPHLGAHMGHGGTVVGESVRCPFHGFRFGTDGACVATGYDTKPPKVSVATKVVHESCGVVLVFLDPRGGSPTFTLPDLDDSSYSPLRTKYYRLRGHPQDTTENSVDFGHLSVVHGYSHVQMQGELELEGPVLKARYSMHHPFGLARGSRGLNAAFEVTVRGLGHSMVDIKIPTLGLEARTFVFATPRAEMDLELRIALAVKRLAASQSLHPLLAWVSRAGVLTKLVETIYLRQAFAALANDVEQDFVIWKHKQYVSRPALAQGDGPIARYRRWAEQFYSVLAAEA